MKVPNNQPKLIMTTEYFVSLILPKINRNIVDLNNIDYRVDPEQRVADSFIRVHNLASIFDIRYLYAKLFEYQKDDYFISIIDDVSSGYSLNEYPQSAVLTATYGRGDCEDFARLQYFMHKSFSNIDPYLVIIFFEGYDPVNRENVLFGHAFNAFVKDGSTIGIQNYGTFRYLENIPITDPGKTIVGLVKSLYPTTVFCALCKMKEWNPETKYEDRIQVIKAYEYDTVQSIPTVISYKELTVPPSVFSIDFKYLIYAVLGVLVIALIVLKL